jgi:hypothetical protein
MDAQEGGVHAASSFADSKSPYVIVLEHSPLGVYALHYKTLLNNEKHLPIATKLSRSAQIVYGSLLFSEDVRDKDRAADRHSAYKAYCAGVPFDKCVFDSTSMERRRVELPMHALLCLPVLNKEVMEHSSAWAQKTVLADSAVQIGAARYADIRVWDLCGLLHNQIFLRNNSVPVHYQCVQVPDHDASLCAAVLLLANVKPEGLAVHLSYASNVEHKYTALPLYDWQVCANEAFQFQQKYTTNLEVQKHSSRMFATVRRDNAASVPAAAPKADCAIATITAAAAPVSSVAEPVDDVPPPLEPGNGNGDAEDMAHEMMLKEIHEK